MKRKGIDSHVAFSILREQAARGNVTTSKIETIFVPGGVPGAMLTTQPARIWHQKLGFSEEAGLQAVGFVNPTRA